MNTESIRLLSPELLIASLAIVVFSIDLFKPSKSSDFLGRLTSLGVFIIMIFSLWLLSGKETEIFEGILAINSYTTFFKILLMAIVIGISLISITYTKSYNINTGEYYAIILLSLVGMMLLVSARELITAYISIELMSFSLYVLVAIAKKDLKSNEAAIKYILLGAFSSGLLLYGLVLIYGISGTTSFSGIETALSSIDSNLRILLALSMIGAGFGFKLAIIPFHMWAPDVYEGAPLPITALIAIGSKIAIFALVLTLFSQTFLPKIELWKPTISIIAAITMVSGNILAIVQSNIKRMLAYSSIGQSGYMLMGIICASSLGSSGLILHMTGYAATSMLVFSSIIIIHNNVLSDQIQDYAGIAKRNPLAAICITASLFSLAGLPFFAGFTTKFYLFAATAKEDMLWLAGIAATASVISLYYYLRVIKEMYVSDPISSTKIYTTKTLSTFVLIMLAATIFIGLYPEPIVDIIDKAIASYIFN